MGKIVAWLVVIFLVLLVLRMMALRNARARRATGAQAVAELMVRCRLCGVFLPRAEAKQVTEGYVCATGSCVPHG